MFLSYVNFLYRESKKKSHTAGLSNGCFMGVINLSFAAGFGYGGHLVVEGDVALQDMMRCNYCIQLFVSIMQVFMPKELRLLFTCPED